MYNPSQYDGAAFMRAMLEMGHPETPDKEDFKVTDEKKNKWQFYGTLLVILAFGVLLLFSNIIYDHYAHVEMPHIWVEALTALGHAFIIASVVGATVDAYAKNKLLKEASADIAKFIAGYPLPEEMRPKILEILNNRLIGRNGELTYKITPMQGQPDKIKFEVTWVYEIQNLASKSEKYLQTMWFEEHAKPHVDQMWFMPSDGDGSYQIPNPELERTPEGDVKIKVEEVILKQHQEGQSYKFGFKYYYMFPVEYNEYFFFARPIIGMTIIVECPADFQFFVSEDTKTKTNDRWVYQRAFLTGEQIGVRWRKKSKS